MFSNLIIFCCYSKSNHNHTCFQNNLFANIWQSKIYLLFSYTLDVSYSTNRKKYNFQTLLHITFPKTLEMAQKYNWLKSKKKSQCTFVHFGENLFDGMSWEIIPLIDSHGNCFEWETLSVSRSFITSMYLSWYSIIREIVVSYHLYNILMVLSGSNPKCIKTDEMRQTK